MKILSSEDSKQIDAREMRPVDASSFDIIVSNGKISNGCDIIISFMVPLLHEYIWRGLRLTSHQD